MHRATLEVAAGSGADGVTRPNRQCNRLASLKLPRGSLISQPGFSDTLLVHVCTCMQ